MRRGRRQAGYTLLEVVLVAALTPLLISVVGKVFISSDGLVQKSRADLQAHEVLRRNLEAIANVTRDADIETFDGFDGTGWANQPTFQRAIGADATGRIYGGLEELRWVADPGDVDGIANPGRVVHQRGTSTTLIADRVPSGGFRVRLEGGTLRIRLTTYYVTSARQIAQVTGETAVALRN